MQKLWIVVCFALVLGGCDSGGTSAGRDRPREPRSPVLTVLAVVDSYGTDSEEYFDEISQLDPRRNSGEFELYWFADAVSDYTAVARLSSDSTPGRGIIVGSFDCGPFELCDATGSAICRYTQDFQMGCGFTPRESVLALAPIANELNDVPQIAYLHLEVCNYAQSYCEVGTLPVELF